MIFKIFFIAVLSLPLFVPFADENKKDDATVEQSEGLYIFIMSKPVAETNYLGTLKVGSTITDNPLHTLIKKCRKEYPGAEALIIDDVNLQKAKANAVTFK
jgi:hypothetical protein